MTLRLALPSKGRLQDDAVAFFAAAGITIRRTGSSREYAAVARGLDGLEILLLQAGEMPARLAAGDIHLAVTGEDLVREKIEGWARRILLLKRLGFGRADLIVAAPTFWLDVTTMADLDEAAAAFRARHGFPLRAATKYHRLSRDFFAARGVADYRLIDSQGATEGAPAAGAAEIIVDITSSGETLRANNLKILEDGLILRSEATLCAALSADWTPEARTTMQALCARIDARDRAKDAAILNGATITPAAARFEAARDMSADGPVTLGRVDMIFSQETPTYDAFAARLQG